MASVIEEDELKSDGAKHTSPVKDAPDRPEPASPVIRRPAASKAKAQALPKSVTRQEKCSSKYT